MHFFIFSNVSLCKMLHFFVYPCFCPLLNLIRWCLWNIRYILLSFYFYCPVSQLTIQYFFLLSCIPRMVRDALFCPVFPCMVRNLLFVLYSIRCHKFILLSCIYIFIVLCFLFLSFLLIAPYFLSLSFLSLSCISFYCLLFTFLVFYFLLSVLFLLWLATL